ncbi:MAG: tetratricopeptide repeat protein [Cyclobacteriaceae bacterium]|nr:tetratricopeptide repeat protein [Cyclobacteriaceae bacterium]
MMGKVIQFPIPNPEKFGFKPVRKKKSERPRHGQLNLFAGGKVVNLNRLSVFEEALLLDEQGDSRAANQYAKAIKEGDAVADAYCNLGILESERKNHSKAIDCFTKSLREDPRHFESHYNLANVYAELGNLPLAKVHYQISIEIEPSFPNGYFNLGLTLAMNRELEEAIQTLTRYRSLVTHEECNQVDELIASLSRSLR